MGLFTVIFFPMENPPFGESQHGLGTIFVFWSDLEQIQDADCFFMCLVLLSLYPCVHWWRKKPWTLFQIR
jgi:hypothetical protein